MGGEKTSCHEIMRADLTSLGAAGVVFISHSMLRTLQCPLIKSKHNMSTDRSLAYKREILFIMIILRIFSQ